MSLKVVPLWTSEANRLVRQWHRHHRPLSLGYLFSIGAALDGKMVGAAIVGRPTTNHIDFHEVCEVRRLVTDGTQNACSLLYSACARAAKAMGYLRIITYILDSEPGVSLKASGWSLDPVKSSGGKWHHEHVRQLRLDAWANGVISARANDHPIGSKQRWSKDLT